MMVSEPSPGQGSSQGSADPFAALDEYDVRHLVTHLSRAERDRDVHKLLRMEAGQDGKDNGWFAEKQRRGDVGGFLDDMELAWGLASSACLDAIAHARPATALALEIRYQLIASSINSLARNLPPTLLAALVATGAWSTSQAIRYAAQQPFAPLRAEAFALLSAQCEGELSLDYVRQAYSAARAIQARPDWRVRALGQVAAHAPPQLRRDLVREGLDVLREIGLVEADENAATLLAAAPDDVQGEVEAVLVTLPVTAAKPVRPGVEGLAGRPDPWTYGIRRFAEVLPGLSQPARQAVLTAFRGDEEPVYKGVVLASCAGTEPALANEAVQIARSIVEPPLRAEVIATVTPHLDPETRAQVLDQIVEEADAQHDPQVTAQVLTVIAPALPGPRRRTALAAALAATRAVEDSSFRSYLLRFLAAGVPADMLVDLAVETERLSPEDRGRVVAALAPRVPRPMVLDLLRLSQQIADTQTAIGVVVQLAESAPPAAVPGLVTRALSTVLGAPDAGRVVSLEELAPLLSTDHFALATGVAGLAEGAARDRAWRTLAEHATDDVRLALVERSGDQAALVCGLRARAATASGRERTALLRTAWRTVTGIDDLAKRLDLSLGLLAAGDVNAGSAAGDLIEAIRASDWTAAKQADGIASLVPFTPADDRTAVVDDVLARIRRVLDEQRPWVDELVPRLRPLEYITNEYVPDTALKALFPHLTEAQHAAVFGIIRAIREERRRDSTLVKFARQVPGIVTIPGEYFEVAKTFTLLEHWAYVHCAALPLLGDEQQRQTLIAFLLKQAQRVPTEDMTMDDTALWRGLAPYLSGETIHLALEAAAKIKDVSARDSLMSTLVRHLPDAEAIATAAAIESHMWKARALIDLADRSDPVHERSDFIATVAELGADPDLVPIAALLPAEQRLAVLDATVRGLISGSFYEELPPVLVDHLSTVPAAHLYTLWRDAVPTLTDQSRGNNLARLSRLAPFLRALAGDEIVPDLADTILDVVRWWP
jgi:hypothetical protein